MSASDDVTPTAGLDRLSARRVTGGHPVGWGARADQRRRCGHRPAITVAGGMGWLITQGPVAALTLATLGPRRQRHRLPDHGRVAPRRPRGQHPFLAGITSADHASRPSRALLEPTPGLLAASNGQRPSRRADTPTGGPHGACLPRRLSAQQDHGPTHLVHLRPSFRRDVSG